jgi:hypothetical protein
MAKIKTLHWSKEKPYNGQKKNDTMAKNKLTKREDNGIYGF